MCAAYAGWDEDDILAQVMAQSQQEYLDSLKKSTNASSSYDDGHQVAETKHSTKSSDKATNSKNSHSNTKGSGGKVS